MIRLVLSLCAALFLSISTAHAAAEPDYDPSKPLVTTPWYGMVDAARQKSDMNFIAGMRPHHAGALTMSEEYLASPNARNGVLKQLARGIIHNQKFEIRMLNTVEGHVSALRFADPSAAPIRAQVATGGLAQKEQFKRAPMPGPIDRWTSTRDVSAEDVRFAKAMIVHHQGALVMADDYLNDPSAKNAYLRLMCLDILRDQKMEIALMNSIINEYKGDANAVKIDPSMVHGMDGMAHTTMGENAHHHGKGH